MAYPFFSGRPCHYVSLAGVCLENQAGISSLRIDTPRKEFMTDALARQVASLP